MQLERIFHLSFVTSRGQELLRGMGSRASRILGLEFHVDIFAGFTKTMMGFCKAKRGKRSQK